MKIELNTIINKMNGKPVEVIAEGQEKLLQAIKAGTAPNVSPKMEPLTMREALRVALVNDECTGADGKPNNDARFEKYKQATKIASAKATVDFELKEIANIQESVKKYFATEAMGAILMLLEK